MPREKKQPSIDGILDKVNNLPLEDLLELQKRTVELISEHEQSIQQQLEENKQKLELIRNGGK